MPKYSVYCGGGASFYLADKNGKGVVLEAKNPEEALKKGRKLAESGEYSWELQDDPEPDEDSVEIGEVDGASEEG